MNNDPELFPNPEQFDPFRFSRIRDEAKADGADQLAALNQFVSVNQTSLTFGFGRHACPGRFFAANEIKMVLANAILRYEIRMPGGRTERYPNMEFAAMVSLDPSRTNLSAFHWWLTCISNNSLFLTRVKLFCSKLRPFELQ